MLIILLIIGFVLLYKAFAYAEGYVEPKSKENFKIKKSFSKEEQMRRDAQKEAFEIMNIKSFSEDKISTIKQMVSARLNQYSTIELKTSKTIVGYIVSCNNVCLTLRLAFDQENQMPYSTVFYDSILSIS